jgi:hypothetical protein
MDDTQRIELNRLLNEYNTEETTSKIRNLKHSRLIKDCVIKIIKCQKEFPRIYKNNKIMFKEMCVKRAGFLFNKYTNIFNKLVNNELNIDVLMEFIKILERIENNNIDQHEGSYEAGLLLKKLYLDGNINRDNKGKG